MDTKFQPKLLITVIILSLFSGLIGSALYQKSQPEILQNNNPDKIIEERTYVEESQSIEAIAKATPAVISIVATKDLEIFKQSPFQPFFFDDPFFEQFFPEFQIPQRQQQKKQQQEKPELKRQKIAGGTGFIVKENGLAVTNKHVVNDAEADYMAILPSGREYDVSIVSKDPLNDLAVIQLHEKVKEKEGRKTGEKKDFGKKPDKLPVIKLGDSNNLKIGQKVFAIGYARGEYENSITAGIVSAIGRQIEASDNLGAFRETLSGLIQTDAAINFGNSGGPLINLAGEVVGINTAIDTAASGIGFAIPVNEVKNILASIEKFGKIVRAMLGIRHVILNKERAEEMGLKDLEYGALIVGDRVKGELPVIPGSPAEKAGLRMDDVILEVDNEKITEKNPLQGVVRKHKPGDVLTLKVWRAGQVFDLNVKLEEVKEEKQ